MRYVGSKNKLSKWIIPIIQNEIDALGDKCDGYFEPFVGGANTIDKISAKRKIGYDSNRYLIALFNKLQDDVYGIPDFITEEEYKTVKNNMDDYQDWYVGLVGFCASFGAKFFGGYARNSVMANDFSWSVGAIKNIKKQRDNILDVEFATVDFREIHHSELNNFVVYCDIPYRNTTKYKTTDFPYDDFYIWAKRLAENNTVLISEYEMPNDFTEIASIEHCTQLDSGRTGASKRIEKVFRATPEGANL